MSTNSAEDIPDFDIITEDFEEGLPGVFVYHPNHPIPFLFNFIHINESLPLINTEKGLECFMEPVNEEVKAYGTFKLACGKIDGYIASEMPVGLDEPLVIEYGGLGFRLYVMISTESNVALPCYVPYSAEMQFADRWREMEQLYPTTITKSSDASKRASLSPYQLHTVH